MACLDRVNVGFAKLQMLGDLHFSEAIYTIGACLVAAAMALAFFRAQLAARTATTLRRH